MKIDHTLIRRRTHKIFVTSLFCCTAVTAVLAWVFNLWRSVPSTIRVRAGEQQNIHFYVPATAVIYKENEDSLKEQKVSVNLSQEVTFYGEVEDTYTMAVELFGFIPFKSTSVSVIQDRELIPAGIPIGIYVKTDGVLVIDTGTFQGSDGSQREPAQSLLLPGDYIHKVNGRSIDEKAQLIEIIDNSNGEILHMEVKREEEILHLNLQPEMDEAGEYKLGIWVRDNAQGIGTLTFVDENNYFGALGHGVNDLDTSNLMELSQGNLYKTDIIAVNKGEAGSPGELTGVIAYSVANILGDIQENTDCGIYGVVNSDNLKVEEEALPIGLKQEVQTGPAQIICTIEDERTYYDIEITSVHTHNSNVNRGMEITVTDPRLLEMTGGIVQGMFTSYNGSNNRKASKIKGFLMF